MEASPEVDAAWESLGVNCLAPNLALFSCNYRRLADNGREMLDRPSIVPETVAEFSESHVRVSKKYGGGFVANVEGLHHLHCLVLYHFCSNTVPY